MKIKIYESSRPISRGQIDPIRRAEENLNELGYYFVNTDPDVVFLQKNLVPDDTNDVSFVKENVPIVFLDDSASTGTQRFDLLNHPNVKAYIKKQLLKDLGLYLKNYPRDRYHYHLIANHKTENGSRLTDEPPRRNDLTRSDLNRIFLGWNLGLMERHGLEINNRHLLVKENRNIDIHYSVKEAHQHKASGQDDVHYNYHRMICSYEVNRIAHKYNLNMSGKCQKKDYLKKMERSWICVSPYGLGEICFRDFEAITHGAILIKPDMEHLETWPDVFQPWKTYIPCKIDFSDLEDKILMVLNNYEDYMYQIAQVAFDRLAEAWDNQVFALKFDEIMRKVIEFI